MQTQVNSGNFEKFYFEIPIGKQDAINAVKGLLKGLKIENKFFQNEKNSPKHTKDKIAEFDSFIGAIKGSIDDEEVKDIRAKRYAK